MSRYLVNKFLFTVDRDPELVERYRGDPAGTVAWWEAERANQLLNSIDAEATTWLEFTADERSRPRDPRPGRVVRDGCSPVSDAHPVDCHVRAGSHRAPGHAVGLRSQTGAYHPALSRYQHVKTGYAGTIQQLRSDAKARS